MMASTTSWSSENQSAPITIVLNFSVDLNPQ
jgi:hypothetical protein